ncbi:MAG: hypothetical protein WCS35_01525 [Sphaerochaeta sp.]
MIYGINPCLPLKGYDSLSLMIPFHIIQNILIASKEFMLFKIYGGSPALFTKPGI